MECIYCNNGICCCSVSSNQNKLCTMCQNFKEFPKE